MSRTGRDVYVAPSGRVFVNGVDLGVTDPAGLAFGKRDWRDGAGFYCGALGVLLIVVAGPAVAVAVLLGLTAVAVAAGAALLAGLVLLALGVVWS